MTDPVSTSKFLSLVLRHKPGLIGLTLDSEGWAGIDGKQRFAISEDGLRIRARQGHSIDVDLQLQPLPPPERLYHGTATRFVDAIRREGLRKRSRQHVHLSANADTATHVGSRHGKPVVLIVHAGDMAAAGHAFFLSENGVWLTDAVPAAFIDFGDD